MFAHVTFTHLVVNTTKDTFDPDDAQLVSEAFFRLDVGDDSFPDASVQVLHPRGPELEGCGLGDLEVSEVQGPYRGGSWNARDFREQVECYVRDVIGAQGYQFWLGAEANGCVTECFSEQRECWLEISE